MWFQGLRYYVPLFGITALTLIFGGVLMIFTWLVIVSRWLSTVQREVPRGVFAYSVGVILPTLGFLIAQTVSFSTPDSDLYVLIWWLFIIGSFALLLRARKQFTDASDPAVKVAASGTLMVLVIEVLGIGFQLVGIVIS